MARSSRPARRRRLPARRVLAPALVVAVLGVLLLTARSARPSLVVYAPVTVAAASVGVPYAVDEQVCVQADGGAQVREVRGGGESAGLVTELVAPPEGAPVIAFPVPDADPEPAAGVEVEGITCLRVLVTPQEQGTLRAAPLELVVAYGPGRVLTRTFDVTPPTTVEAVRTGPDPRLAGA